MEALHADGLILRPLTDEDAPRFVAAVRGSVDTVGAWMDWCHPDYTEDEALAWIALARSNIEARKAFDIGIFSADESVFCGGVGVNQIDWRNQVGNVGYWVRSGVQGQGIATRAAMRMIRFGFEELGLNRLEIVAAETNLPSRRTAERVGGLFECLARNRLMLHGRPLTGAVYSLVPSGLYLPGGA